MCFMERQGPFRKDRFLVVCFCVVFFLKQLHWQLFPYDTVQGYLSELRVHLCWKIYFKANKNTKHLILK